MQVEAPLEAAILGWVATHRQRGGDERPRRPLVEVLAHDLGLEPNPDVLDGLAAALGKLERQERIVLDAAVPEATDVAPLDLDGGPDGGDESRAAAPPPRIESYSGLSTAPWQVQLNWALRALRGQTDPLTGEGEVELRDSVARLGLNPKDVRHALEGLGLLRRAGRPSAQGPEVWWVDQHGVVTEAALDQLRQPAPAPPVAPQASPVAPEPAPQPGPARSATDLAPIVDALTRLEPRFGQLVNELVDAAESVRRMAVSQSQLLREQTQQISVLRQECDRLFREVADLRQTNRTLRRSSRAPEADDLADEAASLGAAERRFARTGAEIDDKLRRVGRALRGPDAGTDPGSES